MVIFVALRKISSSLDVLFVMKKMYLKIQKLRCLFYYYLRSFLIVLFDILYEDNQINVANFKYFYFCNK